MAVDANSTSRIIENKSINSYAYFFQLNYFGDEMAEGDALAERNYNYGTPAIPERGYSGTTAGLSVVDKGQIVIGAVGDLSFAASEALVKGSTVGLSEFRSALNSRATFLGATIDTVQIGTQLQSDLTKANGNSHDVNSAYFSASLDMFYAVTGAAFAGSAALGVEGAALGLLTGLGFVGAAPVVVPIAGALAVAAFAVSFSTIYKEQVKPFYVEQYNSHVNVSMQTKPIQGRVVDGALSGATVFVDSNYNGFLDAGELSTKTDASGAYSLGAGQGQIVVTGGTDISSGTAFPGTMILRDTQSIVTPLTTLMSYVRDTGKINANSVVLNAFNLDAGIDLQTFDPTSSLLKTLGFQPQSLGGSSLTDLGPLVYAAGAEVAVTVNVLESLFAGRVSAEVLHDVAYGVLAYYAGGQLPATQVAVSYDFSQQPYMPQFQLPGSRMGLTIKGDPSGKGPLGASTYVELMSEVVGIRLPDNVADAAAAHIVDLNTRIEAAVSSKLTGSALISAVGAIQKIAQSEAASLHFGSTVATTNFNGDITSDILFINTRSHSADSWSISNGKWAGSVDLGSHPGDGWQVAGVGNFNPDKSNDVFWYNQNTGETDIWMLNKGHWAASVTLGKHPGTSLVKGIGDFNGDGSSDVLWFDPKTGRVDEWLVKSGKWAGSVDLGGYPNKDWQIAGVGDFNGDHTSDILWANASTGQTDIWQMRNGNWQASLSPGVHNTASVIAGVADFNGDGQSDILWFDKATGGLDLWKMKDGKWAGSVDLGAHPGADWQVSGTGDYNADGNSDVLWSNTRTGENDIWLIANGNWSASVNPGSHSPTDWTIIH